MASLTGHCRREQVFSLHQHLQLYDTYQPQMQVCVGEMESLLSELAILQTEVDAPLPPARRSRRRQGNEPGFEIRPLLYRLTGGVDLTQIESIGPYSALKLVGEIGTDMSRGRTEKHFTAWLALAPRNDVSGGRRLRSSTPPSANPVASSNRRWGMSF